MTRSTIAVALIAGTALLGLATAAPTQTTTNDAEFVERVGRENAAEIELGRLARERASDEAVRTYADRLVRDHGTANAELQALATRKGWRVPEQPDPHHMTMRDSLMRLSGREFDRRLAEEMVRDHEKAVREFERAVQTAGDPDLRDWAQKTLPVLREHQRMAQELSQRLSAAPAALPATVAATPAPPPWCAGAYRSQNGTNFGACPK